MTNLTETLSIAFRYCDTNGIDVPSDLYVRAFHAGALKAGTDLSVISATYYNAVTEALITYLDGASVTGPRNQFRRAAVEALGSAFDAGYGSLPEGDALAWLNTRIEQEMANISALFEQAKQLRKESDFDRSAWVSARADGYTRTLRDVNGMGKMFAAGNQMLTFDGEDGSMDNICQKNNGTCVRLKGQRHRASWWIAHDLVPYRGNPNYDCGAWECRHGLFDDNGNRVTLG